jgi:hypothetical protein
MSFEHPTPYVKVQVYFIVFVGIIFYRQLLMSIKSFLS